MHCLPRLGLVWAIAIPDAALRTGPALASADDTSCLPMGPAPAAPCRFYTAISDANTPSSGSCMLQSSKHLPGFLAPACRRGGGLGPQRWAGVGEVGGHGCRRKQPRCPALSFRHGPRGSPTNLARSVELGHDCRVSFTAGKRGGVSASAWLSSRETGGVSASAWLASIAYKLVTQAGQTMRACTVDQLCSPPLGTAV